MAGVYKDKDYHKKYYLRNKQKLLEQKKVYRLSIGVKKRKPKGIKVKWGPTIPKAVYDDLLSTQGGKCCICNKEETSLSPKDSAKTRRLSLDHDHATGKLRGLLCNRCNSLLGYAKDSPEILESAIRYLQKYADTT